MKLSWAKAIGLLNVLFVLLNRMIFIIIYFMYGVPTFDWNLVKQIFDIIQIYSSMHVQ